MRVFGGDLLDNIQPKMHSVQTLIPTPTALKQKVKKHLVVKTKKPCKRKQPGSGSVSNADSARRYRQRKKQKVLMTEHELQLARQRIQQLEQENKELKERIEHLCMIQFIV